ncbi:MAG: peptide-methionine (R)-S-oxide reductase MsrB [Gammaproteobacteria bacterium]|nr:peptide-methionine (R)-S-oxide reductase MsrB [Gammaproteobacteria bacterium]
MKERYDSAQNGSKSENDWLSELGEERFFVLRKKGTERAFSGKYLNSKAKGLYSCGACGESLFSSNAKYDSGSGWPSFFQPIDKGVITEVPDSSLGMLRTEVVCSKCQSHLGHLFPDGPVETGLRYCINSVSLDFQKSD